MSSTSLREFETRYKSTASSTNSVNDIEAGLAEQNLVALTMKVCRLFLGGYLAILGQNYPEIQKEQQPLLYNNLPF